MGLSIDSSAVLRAIADHPDAFPAVKGEIDEFARKVLAKQVKHKTTDLGIARLVRESAGEKALATVLDGFAPNEIGAFLKKLDPHNGLVKDGDPSSVRAAIDDLIAGRAEVAPQAPKLVKAPGKKTASKAPTKPNIGDVLGSKVHAGDIAPKKAKVQKVR